LAKVSERKPRYIAPMKPPRIAQPSDPSDKTPLFRLDGSELFLFDSFAQEPVEIAGTDCTIFQRNRRKTTVDPYYREPISIVFDGPFAVRAHVEWAEQTPEASEAGLRYIWPSAIWVPRKTIEDVRANAMHEGDIVHFWRLPYFDKNAVEQLQTQTGGFFFDVIKINEDGHLNDAAQFVAFRCSLSRRSNAPPELNFNVSEPAGSTKPC
jgi:hypothetical protein